MNIYQFPATCHVCGGDGVGTIRTAAAAWDRANEIRHTDPRVCARNLERRERLLSEREASLPEKART